MSEILIALYLIGGAVMLVRIVNRFRELEIETSVFEWVGIFLLNPILWLLLIIDRFKVLMGYDPLFALSDKDEQILLDWIDEHNNKLPK